MDFIAPWLDRLERLHSRLADEESKTLLVKIWAFRALGHGKVKLPFNTPELWRGIEAAGKLASTSDFLDAKFNGLRLVRLDLASLEVPVSLYSSPAGAYIQFVLQAYRCQLASGAIEVRAGDCVVDGGGCWGDTALYFARKAGPSGRVFTFEFTPTNLGIMRKNLALNPSLESRVEVVERALWDRSGVSLGYTENGPGTKLAEDKKEAMARTAVTMSIDDLVTEEHLPMIDFIKMDIEGAELTALKGARETMLRFKPRLAVCVYHRLEDFFDIPDYLESLGLNYRFFLRHFSIHAEETVLFACAD
ncbi:MAG: FkbM family methyltransferase [Verrucomicrobia bacterium]|nr:FkbM family methyltransferase [Verrucomicrobiota bacterium]